MTALLADLLYEFRRHKNLADRALEQLSDEVFFRCPAPHVNPAAIIVKHLAGNLTSRWTDLLVTDGDKPMRDRESEFQLTADDTRAQLMESWERGWSAVLTTVASLEEPDCARTVTIRGEAHTVHQALIRGLVHVAYHTGQILYLLRLLRPDSRWLTIAPGESNFARGAYLKHVSGHSDSN